MDGSFLNKQIIDYFIPKHTTKVCSDEQSEGDWIEIIQIDGESRKFIKCPRCYLLNALKWKYINPKYNFTITIEEE